MLTLTKIASWLGSFDVPHLPISTCAQDSRLVKKGGLFFALKGEKSDGCDYLSQVSKSGAFAAVVPKDYRGPDFGLTLFYVDNVLESMHFLAKRALEERKTKVIGITGSVGKTTTRYFLTQLLEGYYKIGFPPKNYNSQRTMPLVILNALGDEEFLVLEMAMDRPNEIKKLVDIAPPEFVILTSITLGGYFGEGSLYKTMREVAASKSEIFCSKTEYAVVHVDSAQFEEVRDSCFCSHTVYPSVYDFDLPYKESHLRECLSGAIEMALYLGVTARQIILKLPHLKTFERRFEKVNKGSITFINDTYNSAPKSCFAALNSLPEVEPGKKKIVVFGSMAGLGDFSLGAHLEVAREALKNVDELLCLGKDCKPMVKIFQQSNKKVELFETKEELEKAMKERASSGDVVLVKGSNSHRLWEIMPK